MADVFEKYVTPRPEVNPTIYAYKLNGVTTHDGYIKVGYTDRDVKQRIRTAPYKCDKLHRALRGIGNAS